MSRKINFYTHSNHPTKIEEAELYMMCEAIHHTPEDFYDGDLAERIEEYKEYELVEVDLTTNDIDLEEWASCEDTIEEYMEEIEEDISTLPICLINHHNSIIDGVHRLYALKNLGHTKVLVYKGIKQ
jgi:Mg2+ and Co2+ transporter CorA